MKIKRGTSKKEDRLEKVTFPAHGKPIFQDETLPHDVAEMPMEQVTVLLSPLSAITNPLKTMNAKARYPAVAAILHVLKTHHLSMKYPMLWRLEGFMESASSRSFSLCLSSADFRAIVKAEKA